MDLVEIICLSGVGFSIGTNWAQHNLAISYLNHDFRNVGDNIEEYENDLKFNKKNSFKDFILYYLGYPGRKLAYRELKNSKNWEPI